MTLCNLFWVAYHHALCMHVKCKCVICRSYESSHKSMAGESKKPISYDCHMTNLTGFRIRKPRAQFHMTVIWLQGRHMLGIWQIKFVLRRSGSIWTKMQCLSNDFPNMCGSHTMVVYCREGTHAHTIPKWQLRGAQITRANQCMWSGTFRSVTLTINTERDDPPIYYIYL